MMGNKKILPLEEQTMLLTSMLFARKHLDELLSFLPEHQSERMHEAKGRFLKLEQKERIKQIILELRRLLLVKEHNIRWIHKSWIDEELKKEPEYLRVIIQQWFLDKKNIAKKSKLIPLEQIVQSFLSPFLKIPHKVAIFDPVLMRLQSLNRTNQEQTLSIIGQYGLSSLSYACQRRRFIKFIMRNYQSDIRLSFDYTNSEGNAFSYPAYKQPFLSFIIKNRGNTLSELTLASGLMVMATYLSSEKPRWHRTIEFVLARRYGLILRTMLKELSTIKHDPTVKPSLSNLLIESMAEAFV